MVRLSVLTCLVATSVLAAAAFAKPVRFADVAPAVTPQLLPRSAGQVTSFAFDPADPSVVYAGTRESVRGTGFIYSSTDGGGHWQLSAALSAPVTALAADPQRPGTLFSATGVTAWTWPNGVATFQGWKQVAVYRTVNGGRSWQRWSGSHALLAPSAAAAPTFSDRPLSLGQGWVTALAVDPNDTNVVYAGTGLGIQRSTDGGRSWQTVLSGRRFIGIWGLAVTAAQPHAIYAAALIDKPGPCRLPTSGAPTLGRCDQTTMFYKSVDGGKTWRATDLRRLGLDGPVALDAQRPWSVYAAGGFDVRYNGPNSANGIFETADGGHSWRRLTPASTITALAVDPTRTSTIYAGIYRGRGPYYRILKSTDTGRKWTVIG